MFLVPFLISRKYDLEKEYLKGWRLIANDFVAEDAYNEHIYEEIPETRQQRLRPLPPIPEGTSLRQGCSTGGSTTTNFNMKQTLSGKYTDKNEKEIFLICEEIQMGSVAKSYMRILGRAS
jgi:hypothetical protein